MRFEVFCVLSAIFICSEATYLAGLGAKYGYGGSGLGYPLPVLGKAPVPYALPAVGFNTLPVSTLPLDKTAYSTPLDFDSYGIFYDGGSAYGLIDPSNAAGLYGSPVKYTYAAPLGLVGKYGYPWKK